MRNYRFNGGLLVTTACTSADYSALLKVPSPAADTENNQQAIPSTTHTIPETIPRPLIQFLKKHKNKLLALLKIIKDNSARLWNKCQTDKGYQAGGVEGVKGGILRIE